MNEIIAEAKKWKTAYNSMKQEATEICRLSCLRLPRIDFKMQLYIIYHCKNKRRDMDNIAVAKKFIFDGMIKAGKIKNDGWKEIGGWTEEFRIDKKNPRIEVIISEYVNKNDAKNQRESRINS